VGKDLVSSSVNQLEQGTLVVHLSRALTMLVAGVVTVGPVHAKDWPLVTPAELALKSPRLDPRADAEALLWDVRVTDDTEHDLASILEHHVRIKIFTDRGREAHSKVELPYTRRRRVREIEGRTIAPDGSITALRGQDVFDRNVVRTSGLTLRVKSFVMPAAVTGSIIEYSWKEVRDDTLAHYLELPFQREIPVHLVRYHLRPLASVREFGYQMRTESYNLATPPERVKEGNDYTAFIARDMPALKTEPYMPPASSVKAWMLVYYADLADVNKTPEKFWTDFAKQSFGALKPHLRASPEVRQAAAELKKGGTAPTLEAVVVYVRGRVKRDDTDTADASASRDNKIATDALKQGAGSGTDVTLTVAAVAMSAGLNVKLALVPDRSEFLTDPRQKQPHFIDHLALAVAEGDGWRFVDPANEHAKGGHLNWTNDGQWALLLDDKAPQMVPVPVSPEQASTQKRTANLTLAEDGTLGGDVVLEWTGHQATARRERDDDETPQDRERAFVERIVTTLPGAVVSNVAFEQLENPEQPYVIRYSLRVPGYAQRTGARLFVQPGVLQRGVEPMFSDPSRAHRVLLPYGFRDDDTVNIALPAGFEVESIEDPGPSMTSDGSGFYNAKVTVSPDRRRVTYTRGLTLGGRGQLSFSPTEYLALKAFLDGARRIDGHTVTLRRVAVTP
jgi:hypothetical protein